MILAKRPLLGKRPVHLLAVLNVAILALLLVSGTMVTPSHDHHGDLEGDHTCVVCHMIGAPVDLSGSTGDIAGLAIESPRSISVSAEPDVRRPAQEPARSSHPLRGPPTS